VLDCPLRTALSADGKNYNASSIFRSFGMSIFVKHCNRNWRKAKCYTMVKHDKCLLMSVAHVFSEFTADSNDSVSDSDSEFDSAVTLEVKEQV
jgi:hypothetical protein